jgi:hypothetical protein
MIYICRVRRWKYFFSEVNTCTSAWHNNQCLNVPDITKMLWQQGDCFLWMHTTTLSCVWRLPTNEVAPLRSLQVRSPTEAEDFSSSLCVQTGSGAHPASCPMGTGGSFSGVKRGRGVTLTTHPRLVPRLRMSRSYTSSPPMCLHGM